MPGRHATLGGDGYRYGFNGKEGDNEVYGEGNNYDFGARIYDARIGRWLSVDPVYMKFPDSGPYNSMGNNPIIFIDPTGEEIKYSGNPRQKIGLFVVIQVAKMRSFTVRETFKQIKSSDNILTIKSLEKGSSVVESEHLENADRIGIGANATLFLNMSKKNRGRNPDDEFEDAAKMTRITTIGHEGLHAYHHLYGLIKMYDWNGNIVSDEEEEAGLFENLTRSDLRTGLRLTYNQKVGQEYGEAKLLDYLGDFSRSHYDNKKERKALV
jgi:RHS repeat-associated protein